MASLETLTRPTVKKIFYPKISYTHPLKKNKFTHEKLFHARLKEKLFFLRFTSFFKKN